MVLSSSDTQADLETRFSNLLQPIRDLTKNWDVDIAAYLEDYLEELDKVVVTFDGGLTTMNFAEAAMLIQGSVSVYSKKVEYLYSLVYQMLDLLVTKKKQKKGATTDEANDGDDEDVNTNDDEEFLSLDDLQGHKNIVLKEDVSGNKAVMPIPQMPVSLIPMEEGEKGDNPLLSKTGEVLASRNDFKMNTSCVHQTGMLLLDMSYMALLELSVLSMASTQATILQQNKDSLTDQQETSEAMDCAGSGETENIVEKLIDGQSHDISTNDHDMDDNDYDPPGDEVDGAVPVEGLLDENPMEEEAVVRRSERKKVQNVPPKPVVDPWEMLDPHDAGNTVEKKIKRVKNYKILSCLEDNTSKKRKRKQKEEKQLPPLADFISQFYSHAAKFPKNPLKVISFMELEQPYWEEFKRRQAVLQNKRGHMTKDVMDDQNDDVEEDEDRCPAGGGFEDDDIEDEVDEMLMRTVLINDKLFETVGQVDDDDDCGAGFGQTSGYRTVDDGIVVTGYEELVKQHVEQYLASAEEYAQITALSKRVSEWEEKVLPRLQEEDNHEPFDINRYGTLIIDNLHKGELTSFQRVVKTKPAYEVCRIFLATLMLANTCNVDIKRRGSTELGMDNIDLTLLSSRRHFEQLEEYQAPSIASKT